MAHFTEEQVRRLAEAVLAALVERGGSALVAGREAALTRIGETVRANLAEEEKLEGEARKLLDARVGSGTDVDRQKLLLMIKKKLAEEKGFPL